MAFRVSFQLLCTTVGEPSLRCACTSFREFVFNNGFLYHLTLLPLMLPPTDTEGLRTEDEVERIIVEKDVLSVVAYRDFSVSRWSQATSIRSDVFRTLFGGSFVWPYVLCCAIVGGGIAHLVVRGSTFFWRIASDSVICRKDQTDGAMHEVSGQVPRRCVIPA